MNDHLWGPSVHVDKSFKKIQAGSDLGQTPPIQAMPVFWEHMVRQLLPNKCYSLLQRNNRTDSNYIQSHPNISRRQSQIFISLRKIMIENHFSQRSNCFPFWSSSGLGLDKKIRILLGTNAPLWAKRHLRVFYSFRWRDYAWLVETKLGRATRRLLNTVANYHCWHFKYDQKENCFIPLRHQPHQGPWGPLAQCKELSRRPNRFLKIPPSPPRIPDPIKTSQISSKSLYGLELQNIHLSIV